MRENIEVQKQEIVEEVKRQMQDTIMQKVDSVEERKEFEEILLEGSMDVEGEIDKYGSKEQMRMHKVCASGLLYRQGVDQRHKMLRQSLFEMFVARKYVGTDGAMLQKVLKKRLDERYHCVDLTTLTELKTINMRLKENKFGLLHSSENGLSMQHLEL